MLEKKTCKNRLSASLESARAAGRKSLLPYLTAGYPDLAITADLLRRMDGAGCQAVEIGFPFSDSIADGPVIQESFNKALENGLRVDDLLGVVAEMRPSLGCALVAMVSMSIVRRRGIEAFIHLLAQVGFDGLIVPDVPVDECAPLSAAADDAGLCNVLMIAPTSTPQRRELIAGSCSGFVYLIAATGLTGERQSVDTRLSDQVAALRTCTELPIIAGFGISTAEQARRACESADGVIIGSAIVRRIGDAASRGASGDRLAEEVGGYVDEIRRAMNRHHE